MNVALLVKNYVDSCKEREPIFVRDVVVLNKDKIARNIAFNKLKRDNIIKSYKKGIYYKPKITMFGELGIDVNKLIEREYVKDKLGNIKGYVTGPVVWNDWKISTQVPNRTWIVTNSVDRNIELQDIRVKLIKPKFTINNDNYKMLQILDAIDKSNEIQDINWDTYISVLANKINNLKTEELAKIIELSKYYNQFVNEFIQTLIEKGLK